MTEPSKQMERLNQTREILCSPETVKAMRGIPFDQLIYEAIKLDYPLVPHLSKWSGLELRESNNVIATLNDRIPVIKEIQEGTIPEGNLEEEIVKTLLLTVRAFYVKYGLIGMQRAVWSKYISNFDRYSMVTSMSENRMALGIEIDSLERIEMTEQWKKFMTERGRGDLYGLYQYDNQLDQFRTEEYQQTHCRRKRPTRAQLMSRSQLLVPTNE